MRDFKSNDEFYKYLDGIAKSLSESGFSEAGIRITHLLHEVAWTTSSELFGELKILFLDLLNQHQDSLPKNICGDLKECIQIIDSAWHKPH